LNIFFEKKILQINVTNLAFLVNKIVDQKIQKAIKNVYGIDKTNICIFVNLHSDKKTSSRLEEEREIK